MRAPTTSEGMSGIFWLLRDQMETQTFVWKPRVTICKTARIKQTKREPFFVCVQPKNKKMFQYTACTWIKSCYLVHCSMIERMNWPMRARNCWVYLEWNCLSRVSRPSTRGGQSTGSAAFLQVIPTKIQQISHVIISAWIELTNKKVTQL